MENHSYYMELALEEARRAYAKGEVPIGAVLVVDDKVIAKAHNTREENQQALNHAEMLVIKEGCEKQGFWRLDVISGVLEEECSMLMKNFFKELRERKKK